MSTAASSMGRARRLITVAAAALVAVPMSLVATSAQAVTPQAVALTFTAVADHATGFPAPVKGQPFDVRVTSVDVNGQPVAVNKATAISLSVVTGSGTLSGTTTGSIPKNSSTGTISGAVYSTYGNAQVFGVTSPALTSTSFTVDVQALLTSQGTKPGKSAKLVTCTAMTATQPTCATLLLPNGAVSAQTILTEQDCTGGFSCRGPAGGIRTLMVDGIANLGTLYTRSAPATLIIGCDKSSCGNGGVKDFAVMAQPKNDATPDLAPACPSKGTIDPAAPHAYCVDYVQSTRDNAGDLFLYLLFADDARGSLP